MDRRFEDLLLQYVAEPLANSISSIDLCAVALKY